MLDSKTRMMLEVASTLTASDLDFIRGGAPVACAEVAPAIAPRDSGPNDDSIPAGTALQRGERERLRTRESKVSTACLGTERRKHEWWPIGTQLTGSMGPETFTAEVVENARVKSGRGVLITSGPAQGKICNTPTRAALEATEAYRQANGLGRGGGVTNGWTFWKPQSN